MEGRGFISSQLRFLWVLLKVLFFARFFRSLSEMRPPILSLPPLSLDHDGTCRQEKDLARARE